MSQFSVTILGSNSSIPTKERGLTSQIIDIANQLYMIDCGEGTQLQLTRFNIKRNKINAVFISHLHGDHLYGLPGFITSYAQLDRKKSLKIYGPTGIRRYLDTIFEVSEVFLSYPLEVYECDVTTAGMIYEDPFCSVSNFTLSHRIPAQGFIFKEKTDPYKIDVEKLKFHRLSVDQIKNIKAGKSIEREGLVYSPEYFCKPPTNPRKFVFASDTTPLDEFPDEIMHADVLYHEATYLHDLEKLALERGHSTSVHAALFANKIEAKKLIIGHFSSRYRDLSSFHTEAGEIFTPVELAKDGKTYIL